MNPESVPVAPRVNEDPDTDMVPVPEKVPFRTDTPPLLVKGLLPSGKLQLLAIVLVPLEV